MKIVVLGLLLMAPAFSKDWRLDRKDYKRAIVEARIMRAEVRREMQRAQAEVRREVQGYRTELRRELRDELRQNLRDTFRHDDPNAAGMHRIF